MGTVTRRRLTTSVLTAAIKKSVNLLLLFKQLALLLVLRPIFGLALLAAVCTHVATVAREELGAWFVAGVARHGNGAAYVYVILN